MPDSPASSKIPCLPLLPVLLLGLLLFFPSLSVQGASKGLVLWFNVVLPTLAPFMICTQAVTALGGSKWLMGPFGPLLEKFFGLSPSGAYILLCGLLCGYPLGARMCGDFLKEGAISKQEASCLLAICNHPSPMFLSGYVRAQLPCPVDPAWLFLCLYLPILPLSRAAGYIYNRKYPGESEPTKNLPSPPAKAFSLEKAIASTCETMVIIGGYLMLFSILATWIRKCPYGSPALRTLLIGATEITTGVHSLCGFFHDKKALMPVICAVAFGGFSGIFQTKSVIRGTGLSIRQYMGWKLAHALMSGLITAFLLSLPGR